jgi:hypothetical protein
LSTLVTRLCLIALALVVLAGCADSDPLADETAGETFVQERLEHLHPERASYEIAVLCREATGRRLSCGTNVGDGVRQRWTVDLNGDGRVISARPVDSPKPAKRPTQPRVALAVAATKRPNRPKRRRLEVVRLRIAPRQQVLVCVQTGRGRRLFGVTRKAAVSLRSARLRVRLDIRPEKLRPLRPRNRRCR